jgi:hypothetical protein
MFATNRYTMKYFSYLFIFSLNYLSFSQEFEVIPPDFIKSVELTGGNREFSGTPFVSMNGRLRLCFDDIRASEADYYYVIEHYNQDWTRSVLAKNEYIVGFDNIRLFDFNNSFNTLQSFTHYELSIPNKNTRGFKVSGNYKIKILDDQERVIFSRKFIVSENLVDVQMELRRSRNLDHLREKQVIYFKIGRDGFVMINPEETVNVVVVQNNDLNEAIYGLKPQFNQGNMLVYRYDDEASFWGGNEFLFFDNNDIRMGTNRVQRIELTDVYNTFLRTDGVRAGKRYVFNPDINGGFKINTLQGQDARREAEYARVHFSLRCNKDLNGGELHLYGLFNNYVIDDTTLMKFNKKTGLYENEMLLKQGFYNYEYVYLGPDGSFDKGFISGNHDITENDYEIIVYYREIGARFDRVIGIGYANSKNIIN